MIYRVKGSNFPDDERVHSDFVVDGGC